MSEAPRLRDEAYQRFTRGLIAREIKPGQFVSQRELTRLTGMPLGAIRELVPRLEADGLIRTVPQRGIQIRDVDVRLIRDAFGFRILIEREAAAAFAQRAPDAAFAKLAAEHEAILAEAERRVTPSLVTRAQRVDDGMHRAIVDALDNEIVSDAYRVNALKIRLIRQSETVLYADLVAPVMRVHLAVIEAMASRDPARAAAAMEKHITASRDRALGFGDGLAPPPSAARPPDASNAGAKVAPKQATRADRPRRTTGG